jgi:hypothetical protein
MLYSLTAYIAFDVFGGNTGATWMFRLEATQQSHLCNGTLHLEGTRCIHATCIYCLEQNEVLDAVEANLSAHTCLFICEIYSSRIHLQVEKEIVSSPSRICNIINVTSLETINKLLSDKT